MELKFIGRGAAINPLEGNTSAYFVSNDELFLIDCGESVYAPLLALDILGKYKVLNVFITHLHGDHVGGLPSLLVYAYYICKIKVNLVVLDNEYLPKLKNLLSAFNSQPEEYNLISVDDLENKYDAFSKVRYVKTVHSRGMDCYSLVFNTNKGLIFYSGDSAETRIIEDIIASGEEIDKMYVDVISNENVPVHIYIGTLAKVIPDNLKHKIYCMHYDSDKDIEMAKELGFNIVENEKITN